MTWLTTPNWTRLHRVLVVDDDGMGETMCGHVGQLILPGDMILETMPRCSHCCDILQIPRGKGVP